MLSPEILLELEVGIRAAYYIACSCFDFPSC